MNKFVNDAIEMVESLDDSDNDQRVLKLFDDLVILSFCLYPFSYPSSLRKGIREVISGQSSHWLWYAVFCASSVSECEQAPFDNDKSYGLKLLRLIAEFGSWGDLPKLDLLAQTGSSIQPGLPIDEGLCK